MDNAFIKPYSDALIAQKAQLDGVVTRGFQAISIPADIKPEEDTRLHFLGKSAVAFLIIGVIALVGGLIVKDMAIVITGCTALLSGGYLYVKGRQAERAAAFARLSDEVYGKVSGVASQVSSGWIAFVSSQNDSLKTAIVGSAADVAGKVKMIDAVDTASPISLDLDTVKTQAEALATAGDMDRYSPFLTSVQAAFRGAIDKAGAARQTIYDSLAR